MQVSQYIQELLYQYECVTIPNFGAFLTRSFEAKLDDNGKFFPPRKEVTFNQLLSSNDVTRAFADVSSFTNVCSFAAKLASTKNKNLLQRMNTLINANHVNEASFIEYIIRI